MPHCRLCQQTLVAEVQEFGDVTAAAGNVTVTLDYRLAKLCLAWLADSITGTALCKGTDGTDA